MCSQEQDAQILELQLQLDAGSVHGLSIQAGEGEEEIVLEETAHNHRLAQMVSQPMVTNHV